MDIKYPLYSWSINELAETIAMDFSLDPSLLKQIDSIHDPLKATKILKESLYKVNNADAIIKQIQDNQKLFDLVQKILNSIKIYFVTVDSPYKAKINYKDDIEHLPLPELLALSQNKKFLYAFLDEKHVGELRVFKHEYYLMQDQPRKQSYDDIRKIIMIGAGSSWMPTDTDYSIFIGVKNSQPKIQEGNGSSGSDLVDTYDPDHFHEKISLSKKEAGEIIKKWIKNQYTKVGRRPSHS